jgi:putative addiction module killer protein
LEALPDRLARARIRARLARVEAGTFGDCKPLRDGVMELRIDHGREIEKAIAYLKDWKEREEP